MRDISFSTHRQDELLRLIQEAIAANKVAQVGIQKGWGRLRLTQRAETCVYLGFNMGERPCLQSCYHFPTAGKEQELPGQCFGKVRHTQHG